MRVGELGRAPAVDGISGVLVHTDDDREDDDDQKGVAMVQAVGVVIAALTRTAVHRCQLRPEDQRKHDCLRLYSQWVPLILLFLALCFKLPQLMWILLNGGTGLNLEKVIDGVNANQWNEDGPSLESYASLLHRWLVLSKRTRMGFLHTVFEHLGSACCFCLGRRHGTYLTGLYLLTKLSYLSVAIGLLFVLNHFLAINYNLYGLEVIADLLKGKQVKESPVFPRVTLCDFEIRQMQNLQRYTVQCVLSINLFNEKIFIFIWFWLVFLAIMNAMSYARWVMDTLIATKREEFVNGFIKRIDPRYRHKGMNVKFARGFLGSDGILVLRMLRINSTEIAVYDLIAELWRRFKEESEV